MLTLSEIAAFKDRARIEQTARNGTSYAYLGGTTALCRVLDRYKVFVHTDDLSITPHFIMEGFWEIWNTAFICRQVKPGMRALDVGANIGYFSLVMADLIGAEGRLASFEPNSRTAELLRRTMAVNGFAGRSEVLHLAASDEAGTATLTSPHGHYGGASIMGGWAGGADTEEVGTVRLDAWGAANGFKPDFIKIDAEGAEQKIIDGLEELFKARHPMSIMFEFEVTRWSDWRPWLARLEAHGFRLHRVDYVGRAEPFQAQAAAFDQGDLFEIFAVRN